MWSRLRPLRILEHNNPYGGIRSESAEQYIDVTMIFQRELAEEQIMNFAVGLLISAMARE